MQIKFISPHRLSAKHIVIGIGSPPCIPDTVKQIDHPNIIHASEYLQHKHVALMHKRITIVGSGQSAAEIFQDLLPYINDIEQLNWYTRSDRLYAMDYSKFALELSTPEYIKHFYHLPENKKSSILTRQHDLYKGINFDLIENIYEELYRLSLNKNNHLPKIQTHSELLSIKQKSTNDFTLAFKQLQTDKLFTDSSDVISQ